VTNPEGASAFTSIGTASASAVKAMEETLDELDRRIVEAETQITGLTATVVGLTQAGADAGEAEAMLRDYRGALPVLRRQRWATRARRGLV
jgi:hypothetical protein